MTITPEQSWENLRKLLEEWRKNHPGTPSPLVVPKEVVEEIRKAVGYKNIPKPVVTGAGGSFLAYIAKFWWILLILIAIILSVRACHEMNKEIVIPTRQGKACTGSGIERISRTVHHSSSWGCRTSLQDALNRVSAECTKYKNECTGSCASGKTCSTGPATNYVDQVSTWLWCDTIISYTCPCSCGN